MTIEETERCSELVGTEALRIEEHRVMPLRVALKRLYELFEHSPELTNQVRQLVLSALKKTKPEHE